jgi:hypothetical protein
MKTHEISILRLRAYRVKAFESGLYHTVESINDSVKLTSPEKLLQEKVDVPESLILEAHKEVCNEWKSHIEKDFPDVFKKDEYFNFDKIYNISTIPSHEQHPFTIGDGWCECHDEKRFTSLFINKRYWEMESSECLMEGHRMIKLRFKKKKNG